MNVTKTEAKGVSLSKLIVELDNQFYLIFTMNIKDDKGGKMNSTGNNFVCLKYNFGSVILTHK